MPLVDLHIDNHITEITTRFVVPGTVVHRSPWTGDSQTLTRGYGHWEGSVNIAETSDWRLADRINSGFDLLAQPGNFTRISMSLLNNRGLDLTDFFWDEVQNGNLGFWSTHTWDGMNPVPTSNYPVARRIPDSNGSGTYRAMCIANDGSGTQALADIPNYEALQGLFVSVDHWDGVLWTNRIGHNYRAKILSVYPSSVDYICNVQIYPDHGAAFGEYVTMDISPSFYSAYPVNPGQGIATRRDSRFRGPWRFDWREIP